MQSNEPPPIDTETQLALFIAMVIRNAMENFHHEHLTDEQMKQLNPIIRNAACTALHAYNHYRDEPPAKRFIDYHMRMIPKYWEQPELLQGYIALWEKDRLEDWDPD